MPSTDSGGPKKVVGMPSERVVGLARNEWTASIGIAGRHGPDYAPKRPQAQVDELTALQDATQAEPDALLPSVLDRAFKGEL